MKPLQKKRTRDDVSKRAPVTARMIENMMETFQSEGHSLLITPHSSDAFSFTGGDE